MIANYRNRVFSFTNSRRKKELITVDESKIDVQFSKVKDFYYKIIDIEDLDLTDVFDIEFWVKYDVKLPNVNNNWKIGLDGENIHKGKILIRFAEGILPGWKIEEKNVCSLLIDPLDVLEAKVIFKYVKKNGNLLNEKYFEEKKISINELMEIHKRYRNGSL